MVGARFPYTGSHSYGGVGVGEGNDVVGQELAREVYGGYPLVCNKNNSGTYF